jgi:hypothetical protein
MQFYSLPITADFLCKIQSSISFVGIVCSYILLLLKSINVAHHSIVIIGIFSFTLLLFFLLLDQAISLVF